MNNIAMILLLTLLQFIAGSGLLRWFKIQLRPGMLISLSILMGIAIFSAVPFILQLLYIPVTSINVFSLIGAFCVLLNLNWKRSARYLRSNLSGHKFSIKIYEIPFLLVFAFIVFVSAWRCFYYPPTPVDLNAGAEVIAEYTVREKTMINSVFTLHLETFNNHFKSPFLACLQIIYKYAGFPFGQIWLCNVFICFIIFLYHAIGQTLHRLLAGLLLLMFLAIPEMYAYTFMVLFDYSNTVFFFLATFFLLEYFKTDRRNLLRFSGLLMGIATYIRSETLVLAAFLALALIWYHVKHRDHIGSIILSGFMLLLPAAILYFLTIYLYINFYLPIEYNVEGLMNKNLLNLSPLWQRFRDMNSELIFSTQGFRYYGYFVSFFLLILLSELAYSKKLDQITGGWLFAVMVIYLGMPFLGYLLPLLDLDNSTKRGLFKMFPLMLLFIANTSLLKDLSASIRKWELARL